MEPAPDSPISEHTAWWQPWLIRWYESLTRNDQVQPADLIYVMAGRIGRKRYGIELFRAGAAPLVVLSIERFEVSKVARFGLEGFDQLIALRDRIPPAERFFYWKVDVAGNHFEKRKLPRCNTYGEALALRQFLEEQKARTVLVVSSGVHLRRVALTFYKVFRNSPIEFRFCPAPPDVDGVPKCGWWNRPEDRRYVLLETVKLAGYHAILALPDRAIRLLMPLKGDN
jgi:uncharacterized SAM-binding protein YcdF (DUF218 family)